MHVTGHVALVTDHMGVSMPSSYVANIITYEGASAHSSGLVRLRKKHTKTYTSTPSRKVVM